jgi:hypothetical protein
MKNNALLATPLLLAVIAVGSSAAPATAAEVIYNTTTFPIDESGVTTDCLPGVTGDLSGVEVIDSRIVQTPTGGHLSGTSTQNARIDWTDGSYTIIKGTDRVSSTETKQTSVLTVVSQDVENTYSASGEFLFRTTLRSVYHFTVTDGVTRVEVSAGQPRVIGNC